MPRKRAAQLPTGSDSRSAWTMARAFSLAGQVLLLAVAIAAPWTFGAVAAVYQVPICICVLLAAMCSVVADLCERDRRGRLPFALVPLAGAIALGCLQLAPIPSAAESLLSPRGAELRREFIDLDTASARVTTQFPISLYPAATRRDLAMLLVGVAVFTLGAQLFKHRRAQLVLCGAMAVNGAALVFFGLIQQLTWNGRLYWTIPLSEGGLPFGPFVNRNNAAGFFNLSLAGALGLLFWAFSRGSGHGSTSWDDESWRNERTLAARVKCRVADWIAGVDAVHLVMLSLAGLLAGGILCTLSRGGMLALAGGGAVTALAAVAAARRARWAVLVAAAVAAGVGVAGWVGMSGLARSRLATMGAADVLSTEARMEHWRDSVRGIPDFWRAGSGLGTYRYVYRLYETQPSAKWFFHAENQYLEAILDGGLAGLGLLLAAITAVAAAALRLLRASPERGHHAFALAGVFALSTQAIHACFDFGLYLPSNMIVLALLCGGLAGRATLLSEDIVRQTSRFVPRRLAPLWATALAGALVLAFIETRSEAAVEDAMAGGVPQANDPEGASIEDLAELEQARRRLDAALRGRRDDAERHLQLANLWIRCYRLRAAQALHSAGETADPAGLWQSTSLASLHEQAHRVARSRGCSQLARLRMASDVVEYLRPAWKHAGLAQLACPLMPLAHRTLAELAFVVGVPGSEARRVRCALRLAGGDVDLWFQCGSLDFHAGRADRAYATWRRCWSMSPDYERSILRLASQKLTLEEMIRQVVPESPPVLVRLAMGRYAAAPAADRLRLARQAERLLPRAALPEAERYYVSGCIHALDGDLTEAAVDLERTAQLRPEEIEWRYMWAVVLYSLGRVEEARTQAKWCVRVKPGGTAYRKLLEKIHHHIARVPGG